MARKPERKVVAEEAWEAVMAASGELAGSVAIKRKVMGKEKYLGLATVEEMRDNPYETLLDRYGGGDYVVQLRDDTGFIGGTRTHFYVEGLPLDPAKEAKRNDLEGIRAKLEKLEGGGGRDAAILVELIRQIGELRTVPPAPERPNLAEVLTALSPILAPIVAKLLESKDPGPSSMDRLEELTALMDIAKGLQGPQDGIGALAKTMGEPIAKLLTAHAEQSAAGGAPPTRPNPERSPVANGRPVWYRFLAPIVPQAMRWAEQGKDVHFRADFIVDELQDEQLGPVHATLSTPGFREQFYKAFPEALPHVAWFDALFQRILFGIMDDTELAALEAAGELGDEDEDEDELQEQEDDAHRIPGAAEVGGPGTVADEPAAGEL